MNRHDAPNTGVPDPAPYDEALEKYVDGLLEGIELEAFLARMASEPRLAAEVAAHRQLQDVLRAKYAQHGAEAKALSVGARRGAPLMRFARLAGIAAAVAVVVGAAVWFSNPGPRQARVNPLSAAEVQARNKKLILDEYAAKVASGFKPDEVCTTDDAFQEWTERAFGASLRPTRPGPGEPSEPVYAGWTRSSIFSNYTGLLLAMVDGANVMVVIDSAPPERFVPEEDATGPVRLFRKRLGDVWLLEVSPLGSPRVLPRVRLIGSGEPPAQPVSP